MTSQVYQSFRVCLWPRKTSNPIRRRVYASHPLSLSLVWRDIGFGIHVVAIGTTGSKGQARGMTEPTESPITSGLRLYHHTYLQISSCNHPSETRRLWERHARIEVLTMLFPTKIVRPGWLPICRCQTITSFLPWSAISGLAGSLPRIIGERGNYCGDASARGF